MGETMVMGAQEEQRPRRRRRPRVLAAVVLVVLVLFAIWVGWILIRGVVLVTSLDSSMTVVRQLREEIVAGAERTGDAKALLDELRSHSATAAAVVDDPLWLLSESFPGVGPNLRALREVAGAVRDLVADGLPPLIDAVGASDGEEFSLSGGTIDLPSIIALRPRLIDADDVFQAVDIRVKAVEVEATVPPLRAAVEELAQLTDEAASVTAGLRRAAELIPALAGGEGTRNILILVQNNAELRAAGGIPGAAILIRADGGTFSLVAQASTLDFPEYSEGVLPLDEATRSLYGDVTAKFFQNVTATPWFDTSAHLAAAMWTRQWGDPIDTVIAVDPVVLSYLLEVSGPVLVDQTLVSSETAVRVLLHESYQRYADPREQDAFFARTAEAVFDRLMTADLSVAELLRALTRAGDEHRIRVWSAHASEQVSLLRTSFAGVMPHQSAGGPLLALVLNDATGAKMDYYLEVEALAAVGSCERSETTATLTVTLRNTVDPAAELPEYVSGGGTYGVPPGSISTLVAVYGPADGRVTVATVDGFPAVGVSAVDRQRPVFESQLTLAPGEEVEFSVSFAGETFSLANVNLTPTAFAISSGWGSLRC